MVDSKTNEGGCLCGAVRYRVTGEQLRGTICHCTTCRRWSGAPFLSWALFNQNQFVWVTGEPASLSVTPAVIRKYCAQCGSPLTFEFTDSGEIVGVTTGTLDDPDNFRPTRHNWTSSEVAWLKNVPHLPRNPGDAGDEKISS